MNISKETIAIICAIVIQSIGVGIWAGQVTAKLENIAGLTERVERLESHQMESIE